MLGFDMLGIDPDRRRQAVTPAVAFQVTLNRVPGPATPRPEMCRGAHHRKLRKRRPVELFPYATPAGHGNKDRDKPTGQLRSAWSDVHPAKLPGTRCDAVVTTEI